MTDTLRYARRELNADLLRAGAGLALCAAPAAFADIGTVGLIVLAVPAAMFAAFGLRTWRNRSVAVAIDGEGIALAGGAARRIDWAALDALKLSYFSTRRDREAGWMQLTLKGAGTRIALTSSLDGFEEVCRQAWRAARTHELELSDATARNFAALGLGAPAPASREPSAIATGWGDPAEWRR